MVTVVDNERFPKFGMDIDNSGRVVPLHCSPQDANMRLLEGLELHPKRPLRLT